MRAKLNWSVVSNSTQLKYGLISSSTRHTVDQRVEAQRGAGDSDAARYGNLLLKQPHYVNHFIGHYSLSPKLKI